MNWEQGLCSKVPYQCSPVETEAHLKTKKKKWPANGPEPAHLLNTALKSKTLDGEVLFIKNNKQVFSSYMQPVKYARKRSHKM